MDDLLNGLDALLVTNPTNIRYLTGFAGLSPTEREGYVIVTSEKMLLLTNPLYLEQAHRLTSRLPKLNVLEITRDRPLTLHIRELATQLHITQLGFEETDLTVAEWNTLRSSLATLSFTPTRERVEQLRRIKTTAEITKIQKAATLTDLCFAFILKQLKIGVTESEIAWQIETFFRKNGALSAFSPIVAFDHHSSEPHYSSGDQTLTANHLILLDFGAQVAGYCADMTRVVFLGTPTEKQKKAYDALKKAQQQALDLLQHGERSGAALDHAVRKELQTAGFPPYPHSLGHAVGLAIHEAPRLSIRHDELLTPGMVVTVEPGIYFPGNFGIRIEDLVLVKEQGIEILSHSPKDLLII